MVCVIMAHPGNVPKDIEVWIYSFHMPLFFMISGVTFRYDKYADFRSCLKDQVRKLLIPYVLLYLICIPFWYVNNAILGDSTQTISDFLLGMLFADKVFAPMPSGALWFLPALFLTVVAYWVLCNFEHRGKLRLSGSIPCCFLVGVLISQFVRMHMPWHLQGLPMMLVFYHIGYLFGDVAKKRPSWVTDYPARACMIAIVAIAVGTWAAFANGKISMYGTQYKIVLLALLSSCGISLGLALIFMGFPTFRPLDYIGKNSLAFLGFQIPVMRFLEHCNLTENIANSHPLWTALATIVLLFPIVYVVNRWLPFIVGKRMAKRQ